MIRLLIFILFYFLACTYFYNSYKDHYHLSSKLVITTKTPTFSSNKDFSDLILIAYKEIPVQKRKRLTLNFSNKSKYEVTLNSYSFDKRAVYFNKLKETLRKNTIKLTNKKNLYLRIQMKEIESKLELIEVKKIGLQESTHKIYLKSLDLEKNFYEKKLIELNNKNYKIAIQDTKIQYINRKNKVIFLSILFGLLALVMFCNKKVMILFKKIKRRY